MSLWERGLWFARTANRLSGPECVFEVLRVRGASSASTFLVTQALCQNLSSDFDFLHPCSDRPANTKKERLETLSDLCHDIAALGHDFSVSVRVKLPGAKVHASL